MQYSALTINSGHATANFETSRQGWCHGETDVGIATMKLVYGDTQLENEDIKLVQRYSQIAATASLCTHSA
jgi:hypothetical protein